MGWKIFAVFLTLFTAVATVGLFRAPVDAMALMSYLVSLPANVGVLLYAFGNEPRPSPYWTFFSRFFAVWVVACLIRTVAAYPRLNSGHFGPGPLIFALVIAGIFYFFQWLGLRRLSLGEVS
ncbi:MAG TPA: hypothetical protein VH331_02225 [Allosphingosinicella sp.]|jgi:hypothetical protein|nr:hypothetical protein [Allosphingosinicella sp.]